MYVPIHTLRARATDVMITFYCIESLCLVRAYTHAYTFGFVMLFAHTASPIKLLFLSIDINLCTQLHAHRRSHRDKEQTKTVL